MEILVKVSLKDYECLVSQLGSPAHKAIAMAAPTGGSIGGVEFEGYTIPCDEEQARILLETARQHCPHAVFEIQKAITYAKQQAAS